jgi:hypothetical protein
MPPKNELPTEAPTPTPDAMLGEMAAPTPDMAAPAGGQVMVEMPSDAFDAIYTLVTQLASGLETLKSDVDAQKGGAMPPEGEMMPPEAAAMGADEEFLNSLAQEGSMR